MTPTQKPAEKPATPGLSRQRTGEVVSVHPSARALPVVHTDGREMAFVVAGGAARALARLKPGDTVTVHSREDAGRLVAEAIAKG